VLQIIWVDHLGRLKKFVDTLSELNLRAKHVAVCGTYVGRIRVVKKLEKKLPNINLISPSLSVRVNGVTGPIVEDELPKCVDFGKRIASQLQSIGARDEQHF
jgi:flavorubredoxin